MTERTEAGRGREHEPEAMQQLLAQREYALQALIELSQALAKPRDLYGAMDGLLLTIMGQFRLSRACLWMAPVGGSGIPELARTRGVERDRAETLMISCASRLMEHFQKRGGPLTVEKLVGSEEGPVREFAARAGLMLLAPIYVHDELIAILGLGTRQDGVPRAKIDLKLLESSLAIASIAIENGRFYGQLLEKSRELRLARERLGELDRLKFEFLSNINHELRTPLAVIIASLDCLGRLGKEGPDQEFLQYARSQAQKLLGMVEGLLHLAAAGQDTHRPIASIGDIVDAVSAYHRDRLPGVSSGLHEFSLVIESRALQTCFDERHLRTILDALVDNAVKFTPAGGQIRLRVGEASEQGERWARIDVEDNGPGIPSDRLPKLFEPFHQLDGSMTRAAGGLGIGLALARRLAHEMGGKLAAVSDVGSGSIFSLFLPAAVQFAPAPADQEERKGRVLMSQELEMSNLENRGRTAVLRPKGRLDVKTSPLLLQKVSEIQANGQNLVLNLSEVTFMGSSGIGALLVIVEQFQEQAGMVRLASPSPAVASVIKLLNLDRFLAVDSSEEKALSEIGA